MKYLLAISGGSDSMALLYCFLAVAPRDIGVIHIHHHWRDEADAEVSAVATLCQNYHVPFYLYHWNEPTQSESDARDFRYDCFRRVMEEEGYDILVTAHHLNDQVETIIRQVIRGSHPFHMTGMDEVRPFYHGFLWRPFLNTPKQDLRTFIEACHWPYFEDVTNYDLNHQRNRLRHQLLPLMAEENPNYLYSIARQANQLRHQNQFVKDHIEEALKNSMLSRDPVTFDLTQWEDKALYVWVLVDGWIQKNGIDWHFEQTRQLTQLVSKTEGSQTMVWKDNVIMRAYTTLSITKKDASPVQDEVIDLVLNQPVELGDGMAVCLVDEQSVLSSLNSQNIWKVPHQMIKLRHPKQNDKLRIGHDKTQKLRRLFINEKIPANKRQSLWVVEGEEELLGVLGVRPAYLRKRAETGKISYIIYYKLKVEDDNGHYHIERDSHVRKRY